MVDEKGFRILRCLECAQKIRIKISENDYGKKIELTCPRCKAKYRVTIPTPPHNQPKPPIDIDFNFGDIGDLLFPEKK